MTQEDIALSRAKVQLMRIPDTVFYATILFSLKQTWTDTVDTAATNGTELILNPIYFLSLTERQRIGLLVHEILHVALDHMTRLKSRNPTIWNAAADHVINLCIMETRKYELPEGGLQDSRFTNMSTEAVYGILYKEFAEDEDNGGPGAKGLLIPGGGDIQYPADAAEASVKEKDIANIILKASIQAKTTTGIPGSLSGEMNIHLSEVLNPQLPWNVILQNYLNSFVKDDYSWRKPNRRYLPEFYLPSQYSEAVGEVAVAVDCSGSVLPEEFSYFIYEVISMQEALKPEKVTLLNFDTEIIDIYEITQNTDILNDIRFVGGGGTEILPVFQWAKENNPVVMLVFTDGEFYFPNSDEYPECPIVWLIHDNPYFTAPIGEVIHYSIT